jgi:Flp pilus assembly pilin Flp
MNRLVANWRKFTRSESGAVAIEYGLIAGGLLLAIYPAFYLITSSLTIKFTTIASAFTFFK